MTALPLDAAALDRIESGEVGVGPSRGEKIIAQARAALTLRDELAALAAELKDCEKMHGVQLARVEILMAELAECRAKLAQAEQDRNEFAMLVGKNAVTMASSQARERELREALERAMADRDNAAAYHVPSVTPRTAGTRQTLAATCARPSPEEACAAFDAEWNRRQP